MISKQHTKVANFIFKTCSLCNNEVATKIFSPNDCPTPFSTRADDPYGLVKAGKLPVTYQ